MTVAAVAGSAAWWAVTAAVVADAAIIAGSSYGAYSAYEQGKAAEQQAKAANEQAKAQASAYAAQAAESERQAELERDRAGIAQIQGEREAERRSRALSAEIGSIYAATAGNGLLVDGNEDDTFASVDPGQYGDFGLGSSGERARASRPGGDPARGGGEQHHLGSELADRGPQRRQDGEAQCHRDGASGHRAARRHGGKLVRDLGEDGQLHQYEHHVRLERLVIRELRVIMEE